MFYVNGAERKAIFGTNIFVFLNTKSYAAQFYSGSQVCWSRYTFLAVSLWHLLHPSCIGFI